MSEADAVTKHTYAIQIHRMRLDHPLTFSDGERIVAVLDSALSPRVRGMPIDVDVTVLVELPPNATTESSPT